MKKLKLNDLTPMQLVFVIGKKGEANREGEPYNQVMLRERPDGSRFAQFYRAMKLVFSSELPSYIDGNGAKGGNADGNLNS